jgi:hypothetical protein
VVVVKEGADSKDIKGRVRRDTGITDTVGTKAGIVGIKGTTIRARTVKII